MLTFPQLSPDSTCQYPLRRTRHYRTITNSFDDGSRFVLQDPNATIVRWDLTYSGLTGDEVSTLQTIFAAAEGRLNTFTFTDPAANLLVWSEDFSNPVWQRNSLLSLVPGVSDPLGSTRATHLTNAGGAALTMLQTVAVPGASQCCWSVYLRSDLPQLIVLSRDGNTAALNVTASWRRFELSGPSSNTGATSDFGLSLPAGGAIDIFGPQVEAQTGASAYVSTLSASGIYPKTRFDSDHLDITADAPNSNRCNIALMSYTA